MTQTQSTTPASKAEHMRALLQSTPELTAEQAFIKFAEVGLQMSKPSVYSLLWRIRKEQGHAPIKPRKNGAAKAAVAKPKGKPGRKPKVKVEDLVFEAGKGRVALAPEASALLAPLSVQIGGDHYKKLAIQPIQYVYANNLGYCEGNVVKYVTRWRERGGRSDLEKARHYIDLLLDMDANGTAK